LTDKQFSTVKSGIFCLNASDVTAAVQLLSANYQLDKYFIDRLTAVSAAHFDANTATLRQTVKN